MSELYVVSTDQRKPKRSLFERAGSHEIDVVDAYLRERLGGNAVSLVASRLSEFKDNKAIEADHFGCVAVIYRGIEQKIVCNQANGYDSPFSIGAVEPQKIHVATFSTTVDRDLDISDELRQAMDSNDTSMLGLCPYVGIRLDEPVVFDSLQDNSTDDEDDESVSGPQSPPELFVVR